MPSFTPTLCVQTGTSRACRPSQRSPGPVPPCAVLYTHSVCSDGDEPGLPTLSEESRPCPAVCRPLHPLCVFRRGRAGPADPLRGVPALSRRVPSFTPTLCVQTGTSRACRPSQRSPGPVPPCAVLYTHSVCSDGDELGLPTLSEESRPCPAVCRPLHPLCVFRRGRAGPADPLRGVPALSRRVPSFTPTLCVQTGTSRACRPSQRSPGPVPPCAVLYTHSVCSDGDEPGLPTLSEESRPCPAVCRPLHPLCVFRRGRARPADPLRGVPALSRRVPSFTPTLCVQTGTSRACPPSQRSPGPVPPCAVLYTHSVCSDGDEPGLPTRSNEESRPCPAVCRPLHPLCVFRRGRAGPAHPLRGVPALSRRVPVVTPTLCVQTGTSRACRPSQRSPGPVPPRAVLYTHSVCSDGDEPGLPTCSTESRPCPAVCRPLHPLCVFRRGRARPADPLRGVPALSRRVPSFTPTLCVQTGTSRACRPSQRSPGPVPPCAVLYTHSVCSDGDEPGLPTLSEESRPCPAVCRPLHPLCVFRRGRAGPADPLRGVPALSRRVPSFTPTLCVQTGTSQACRPSQRSPGPVPPCAVLYTHSVCSDGDEPGLPTLSEESRPCPAVCRPLHPLCVFRRGRAGPADPLRGVPALSRRVPSFTPTLCVQTGTSRACRPSQRSPGPVPPCAVLYTHSVCSDGDEPGLPTLSEESRPCPAVCRPLHPLCVFRRGRAGPADPLRGVPALSRRVPSFTPTLCVQTGTSRACRPSQRSPGPVPPCAVLYTHSVCSDGDEPGLPTLSEESRPCPAVCRPLHPLCVFRRGRAGPADPLRGVPALSRRVPSFTPTLCVQTGTSRACRPSQRSPGPVPPCAVLYTHSVCSDGDEPGLPTLSEESRPCPAVCRPLYPLCVFRRDEPGLPTRSNEEFRPCPAVCRPLHPLCVFRRGRAGPADPLRGVPALSRRVPSFTPTLCVQTGTSRACRPSQKSPGPVPPCAVLYTHSVCSDGDEPGLPTLSEESRPCPAVCRPLHPLCVFRRGRAGPADPSQRSPGPVPPCAVLYTHSVCSDGDEPGLPTLSEESRPCPAVCRPLHPLCVFRRGRAGPADTLQRGVPALSRRVPSFTPTLCVQTGTSRACRHAPTRSSGRSSGGCQSSSSGTASPRPPSSASAARSSSSSTSPCSGLSSSCTSSRSSASP